MLLDSLFFTRIEAFGGPDEVGEAVVRSITGSGQRPDVKGTLIKSSLREDSVTNVKYYELEFRVESPSDYALLKDTIGSLPLPKIGSL